MSKMWMSIHSQTDPAPATRHRGKVWIAALGSRRPQGSRVDPVEGYSTQQQIEYRENGQIHTQNWKPTKRMRLR